ncbi:MAG: TonB-dependent receptor [Chitinophagaceae bacterium]
MKLTICLTIFVCLQVGAKGVAQKVSLNENKTSLEKVLKKISNQTGYTFLYESKVMEKASSITLKVDGVSLVEALNLCFNGQPLTYKIFEHTVVIKEKVVQNTLKEEPFISLANVINGKVKNSRGETLAGVSVTVKGKTTGTSTNANGNYSIDVPANGTLVFSYVGYATKEMPVNDRTEIDILMEESVSGMDEAVVVGYGTQKKVNLTGSVSEVKFDNTILNRPITNTSQALSGKVPGLWVSQDGGRPGSDNALLRIRGWGSFNESGPLVIVDGVEGSIDQLNPQDIKSVSVLKDAASASIYGSKAANGVVLVTTKSGNLGNKAKINLSSYYGIQSIGLKYDYITNSATWMELWNRAKINSGTLPTFPQNVIDAFRNNSDPYLYPNTDFNKVMLREAPLLNNNISVSGGSENTKYYLSFNYQDQDGILINTKSKKFGISINVDSKINNWITIGGRLRTLIKRSDEPFDTERVPYMWSNGSYPIIAAYNKDGTPGGIQALDANGNQLESNRNPVLEALNGFTKDFSFLTRWNGYGDFRLLKGLVLKTNFTGQVENNLTDRYNAAGLVTHISNGNLAPNLDQVNFGSFKANRTNVNAVNYVWFNTLNYTKKYNKHDVGIIGGMQIEDFTRKNTFAQSELQPTGGITQVDGGTGNVVANGNIGVNRMLSYFGRVNYAFDDKYLLEFNIRADGSSRFAEDKRWGVFPGISAGWRIGKENFMSHQKLFSDLKIRASSGRLGNQNIAGNWPFLSTIAQSYGLSYSFNGTTSPGAALTTLVNEQITWETTTVNEIGLEMFFLKNRLGFVTTVFNKTTNGIIVRLPLPTTIGTSGDPYENIGIMVNKGIEAELTYTNGVSERNKFKYNLSANFSYINNKVTKFKGGKSPDQLYLIREGYSFMSLYGYHSVGIFQTDKEATEYMFANGTKPVAGDIKFEDINKDGQLDYRDQKVIGNTIPTTNFGANVGFSYYGFNLDILLQGLSGVTINTYDRWNMPLGVSGGLIQKKWLNSWTPDNPSTELPHLKFNDRWNFRRMSNFWSDNLTYVKIRNIQMGYTFPKNTKLLRDIDLNIYCNLQNYFTFTDKGYDGWDPERNVFLKPSPTDRSVSDFYPMPKIITVGVNVIF